MANARELALQTLTDILIDGAYSNHALSEQIEKNELTVQDKNFMTELVYRITLTGHFPAQVPQSVHK